MANIREHCSWVTEDREEATEKAKRILSAQIHRLPFNEPLDPIEVPVNPAVMVVGGGIAGIEAALKLAADAARRSTWSRRTRPSAATWPSSTRPSRRSTARPASSRPRCRPLASTPTSS